MKRKIAYILLIAVTFLAVLGSRWDFWRFLLAFEILYGLMMFAWARLTARRLKLSLGILEPCITQGDRTILQVQVKNESIFPAGDIRVKITLQDVSGWQPEGAQPQKEIEVKAGADRKDTGVRQTEIQPVHCGLIKIEVQEARLFDYMGLWSVKISGPFAHRYISVLPQIIPLDHPVQFVSKTKENDGAAEAAAKFGEDTQEIFDTRQYRRGDTLRSIHWKLSAKEEELLVKEYSMPQDYAFRIFLDCGNGKDGVSPEEMDRFLGKAAFFADSCIRQGNLCEFIWYSAKEERICKREIARAEELSGALEELLGICPYNGTDDPMKEETPEDEEMQLRITLKGQVYINGELVEE